MNELVEICIADPQLFQLMAEHAVEVIYKYGFFAQFVDTDGTLFDFLWKNESWCTEVPKAMISDPA